MINSEEKGQTVTDEFGERKYYLDWLRIIAILLVFLYHSTMFFGSEPWHLKNDVVDSNISTLTYAFLTVLGMPLFFFIAGLSTFIAFSVMKERNIENRKYISLRFIRLMVPFFVGILSHIPLQIYLERVNVDAFSGTFLDFYLFEYFNGIYETGGGNFALLGNHLWFLVILFLFSLVTMNFFLFLHKEKNHAKIASFLVNPRVLFLFPVLILVSELIQALLDTPLVFGGWNLFSHLLFYIFGYILAFNQQLMETLGKYIKIIFGLTAISITLTFLIIVSLLEGVFRFRDVEVFFFVIRVSFAWSGVLFILWLGYRYLNRDSKNRKFLNELVLPFYILHQTVLIVLGFFIIQLELDVLMKFLLILSSAFVCISILLLIIREENTIRFLFGMKMRKDKSIRRWIKRGDAKT
ncbi:MAG: acyltransferase family protein [Candidatus Hodarchaeales archaeon]|jgi:peptidoglycan/LPS O-acetylase OafA/YrhL